jgi:hypothetical protein
MKKKKVKKCNQQSQFKTGSSSFLYKNPDFSRHKPKRIFTGIDIMALTSKRILIPAAVAVICIGLAAGVLYFLSGDENGNMPAREPENLTDTFTFFGLGPSTRLTSEIRDTLEGLLGNGGIETRTTIDLTMGDVADFAANFPRLQSLHQSLNYLPRQRIEHDTIQLTYRYARRQNVPFDRIRLVFWGEQRTPLFFSLYSKRDGADFIESIQKKHGEPVIIGDKAAIPRTLYWQKENALLIISANRNRIGFNEYDFGIYYLDNLTALAETEKMAREAAEREKEKTGELAF